jgi:hypothetical protein
MPEVNVLAGLALLRLTARFTVRVASICPLTR